jgi:L-cystine transport system permease protein
MGRAKTIGTATKHVLEAYVFVVIIYIVISLSVRLLFFRLNNKMKYGKEEIG